MLPPVAAIASATAASDDGRQRAAEHGHRVPHQPGAARRCSRPARSRPVSPCGEAPEQDVAHHAVVGPVEPDEHVEGQPLADDQLLHVLQHRAGVAEQLQQVAGQARAGRGPETRISSGQPARSTHASSANVQTSSSAGSCAMTPSGAGPVRSQRVALVEPRRRRRPPPTRGPAETYARGRLGQGAPRRGRARVTHSVVPRLPRRTSGVGVAPEATGTQAPRAGRPVDAAAGVRRRRRPARRAAATSGRSAPAPRAFGRRPSVCASRPDPALSRWTSAGLDGHHGLGARRSRRAPATPDSTQVTISVSRCGCSG